MYIASSLIFSSISTNNIPHIFNSVW